MSPVISGLSFLPSSFSGSESIMYLILSVAISLRLRPDISLPSSLIGQASMILYEKNAIYSPASISPLTAYTAPSTTTVII